MKKTLTTATAILALSVTGAMAQERVIYGGGAPETSTYSGVHVPHGLSVFNEVGIGGFEWSGVSDGTGDNILQVTLNPWGFAYGQSDTVEAAIAAGEPLKVYFDNLSPECFHVVSQDGLTWEQALSTSKPIHVGGAGSGTAWSINNLLENGFDAPDTVNIVNSDPKKAPAGAIGVFVQRPDPFAETYTELADAGYQFSGIDTVDAELLNYLPTDVEIRSSGFLGSGVGAGTQGFRTTCMTTVFFGYDIEATGPDGQPLLDPVSKEYQYLSRLVLPKLETVTAAQMVPPTEGGWLEAQIANLNDAAKERGGSLLERLDDLTQ